MALTTLLGFIFILVCVAGQNKYVDKVRNCYLKDKTNFNHCLHQFWKEVCPLMAFGVPELKIPVMDPMVVDSIAINENGPAFQANANFINTKVFGASKVHVGSVHVDTKLRIVTVNMTFPYLNGSGDYTMKGTIMLLPIDASGRFDLNMTGVHAVAKSHIVQQGTGVRKTKIDMDFTVRGVDLKFNSLIRDDTVGEAIGNLINDNSHQIFQDIKPAIEKTLTESVYNLTKESYSNLPANAFIS